MPWATRLAFISLAQVCDLDGADVLLPQIEADMVLADKGFDADERVPIPLQIAGKVAVIPPNRKAPGNYDQELYKARHLTRELLRKTQAFSRHRHTLRQNRTQLPGRRTLRGHAHLVDWMTGARNCVQTPGGRINLMGIWGCIGGTQWRVSQR
jgi:hypothetical protein